MDRGQLHARCTNNNASRLLYTVSLAAELDAGLYNIVPCIFDPKTTGNFKVTTSAGTLSEVDSKKDYRETEFQVYLQLFDR